jgi:hypothetical protein
LQNECPHGNRRIGEYFGGTINSKQIAHVYYSTISQTLFSKLFLLELPNALSAILYVSYAK